MQHWKAWHCPRGAARSCGPQVGMSDCIYNLGVGVLKHILTRAVTVAVVGVVTSWGNYPVPAHFLEVNFHGIFATGGHRRSRGAYHSFVDSTSIPWVAFFPYVHHQKWSLHGKVRKDFYKQTEQQHCSKVQTLWLLNSQELQSRYHAGTWHLTKCSLVLTHVSTSSLVSTGNCHTWSECTDKLHQQERKCVQGMCTPIALRYAILVQ